MMASLVGRQGRVDDGGNLVSQAYAKRNDSMARAPILERDRVTCRLIVRDADARPSLNGLPDEFVAERDGPVEFVEVGSIAGALNRNGRAISRVGRNNQGVPAGRWS